MPKYYRVNLKDKENNIIYPNIHNNWTFDKDGNVTISNGDIKADDGRIKYTCATTIQNNFHFDNSYNSFLGSVMNSNNTWFSLINVKHRNNIGDGVNYGLQIRNEFGTDEPIQYRSQYNGTWGSWYTMMNLEQEQTVTGIKNFNNIIRFKNIPFLYGNTSTSLNARLDNCSLPIIQVKNGGQYGHNLLIGAGGNTVIGSGESAESFYNNSLVDDTGEKMFITSDGEINFYVNCQDINNKKLAWAIGNDGYLYGAYNFSTTGGGTFSSKATYNLTMGGGSSYVWLDCRQTSDNTVKNNIMIYPTHTSLQLTRTSHAFQIPKNGNAGYGLCNTDGISIIRDHNNKNVTVDATGGTLCLAYENTVGIDILKAKVKINSSGEITAPKFHGVADSLSTLRNSSVINLDSCGGTGDYVKIATMVRNTTAGGNGSFIFIITGTNAYGGLPNAVICELTPRTDVGYYMSMFGHPSDVLQLGVVLGRGTKDVWLKRGSYCSYNRIYILDSQGVSSIGKLAQQSSAPSNVSWFTSRYPITGVQGKANVKNLNAGAAATWNSEYSGYENGTVMFCW